MDRKHLQNLRLDETTLVYILDVAFKNIAEDREIALQYNDSLSSMINGIPGNEGLSDLEVQLMLKDLSDAIDRFLSTATKSTDNIIKLAKILSDHLVKSPAEDAITKEDRELLENMMKGESLLDVKDIQNGDQ